MPETPNLHPVKPVFEVKSGRNFGDDGENIPDRKVFWATT